MAKIGAAITGLSLCDSVLVSYTLVSLSNQTRNGIEVCKRLAFLSC
jgi:hypothetical protein